MEQCIHTHWIADEQLISSCDFISENFEGYDYIYEVIRVIDGKPLFYAEHIARLEESCSLASFPLPHAPMMKTQFHALVETNRVDAGNVKVMVSKGRNFEKYKMAMWFIPAFYPDETMLQQGVDVALIDLKRIDPQIKMFRSDYKLLVAETLKRLQVYELLLLDDGNIMEGSRSNVFFVKGNQLFTAPDEAVLRGVTRQKVLDISEHLGIEVHKKLLTTNALQQMEAAFLCGTSPGVLPISQIVEKVMYSTNHPAMKLLKQSYQQERDDDIANFSW
ncbi:aminotransferase class IV [Bacteroidales bacterium]